MPFSKVSQVLDKKIRKKGAPNPFLSSWVCFLAKKFSKGLFKPLSFSQGTLSVLVPNSSSASTLQLIQEEIREKINQKIGRGVVKKLRIKVRY